jgi:hypothetical protein
VAEGVGRQVDWIHLPVTKDSESRDYFAPLANLRLGAETRVYLGLVNIAYGAEGTARRMELAREVLPEFGITTECGLGRLAEENLVPTLEIMRDLTVPVNGRQRAEPGETAR